MQLTESVWSSLSTSYTVGLALLLLLPPVVWLFSSSVRQCLANIVLRRVFGEDKPYVLYKSDSSFCELVVQKCPALQEPYTPPLLWGRSGHIHTFLFGTIGRFNVRPPTGERQCVVVRDGSTLHYDVYQPEGVADCPYTILVCPGIGNTSESKYVMGFTTHALKAGFRVVVFNHLGALRGEKLTGRRVFTYGGTGDISAVFDHVSSLHPHTRFVGVGFSMGACVLLRFLGEDEERRRRFVCAASVCQGYDPSKAMTYMHDWCNFRRLYNYGIAQKHYSLLRRHSDVLFTSTNDDHAHSSSHAPSSHHTPPSHSSSNHSDSPPYPFVHRCHGDFDHNGMAVDRGRIQTPHTARLRRVSSMLELDEHFTRRVCGFDSTYELYRWTSCVELMWQIEQLPMLLVNSLDDPLVEHSMLDVPRRYVEHNPNALFVIPKHGGHLGFFEGGVVFPNSTAWVDRLIVQFTQACINN